MSILSTTHKQLENNIFINDSDPWVAYRALIDLEGLSLNDPSVLAAKQRLLTHPLILGLLEEMRQWPGVVISSHKSAGQLYHKLEFLAELGLTVADEPLSEVVNKIKANQSEEGLYELPINIPEHFGGSGQTIWAWALCDAPLLLYAVARMTDANDPHIKQGVHYLKGLCRDNGWPCSVSKAHGSFRGPGRKADPCPYATLIMLKLLALYEAEKASPEVQSGIESLLTQWENSRESHPYMFYMGKDFRKLKAPFIWYDIVHVLDVLSHYEFALSDPRFADMLSVVTQKAREDGLYVPESVWTAWKGWEFAQKKEPSMWLTFLICRIEKRMSER